MPKFLIRSPRFINNVLVQASPDFPAQIDLPEGTELDQERYAKDAQLFKLDDPRAMETPKPHFVPKKAATVLTSGDVQVN